MNNDKVYFEMKVCAHEDGKLYLETNVFDGGTNNCMVTLARLCFNVVSAILDSIGGAKK